MEKSLDDITCVIFNWITGRQTRGAIASFQKAYPKVKIIVADDGTPSPRGQDCWRGAYNRSTENAEGKRDADLTVLENIPGVELIKFEDHMGHGLTIDRTIPYVKTDLMLTMDSDIRIMKPGLLEEYLAKYNEDPENIYAVGTQTTKDFMGKDGPYFYSWCDPWFTLWNLEPLKRYPRVSFVELFTPGRNQFGCACIVSMFLEFNELHRPRGPYKAVFFPPPEAQEKLYHLRKDSKDTTSELAKKWEELIDG